MFNIFLSVLVLTLPTIVLADAPLTFSPVVGVPGIDSTTTNFDTYIDSLYALSISIAALLAVVKIVIAGVKWMTTDIVTSKGEAKKDIEGSLLGLIVVLGAVLILTTINSSLVNVNLSFSGLNSQSYIPVTAAADPLAGISTGDRVFSVASANEYFGGTATLAEKTDICTNIDSTACSAGLSYACYEGTYDPGRNACMVEGEDIARSISGFDVSGPCDATTGGSGCVGKTRNGRYVSWEDELAQNIDEVVRIPGPTERRDVYVYSYPSTDQETIWGCSGADSGNDFGYVGKRWASIFTHCSGSAQNASLRERTYAVRVKFLPPSASQVVSFEHLMAGDQHMNYTYALATAPYDITGPPPEGVETCVLENRAYGGFSNYGGDCPVMQDAIDNNSWVYIMFRPTGSGASQCGVSKICRAYMNGHVTRSCVNSTTASIAAYPHLMLCPGYDRDFYGF